MLLVQGGLAIFEGGPIQEFVAINDIRFRADRCKPNPLRQAHLIGNRPGGAAIAMAIDPTRVAILATRAAPQQTLALFDRARGTWSAAVVTATDGTPLPYMTDVELLPDGQVALMAPTATPATRWILPW